MVNTNTHLPVLIVAFPTDTLVFGTVIYISIFCSVPAILRRAGRAEIGLSIVQTVAIDMVHEQIAGDSEYLTMHEYLTLSAIFDFDRTNSVKSPSLFDCAPFMLGQAPVIIRIDDCVLAPGQRDSAESVAVAGPAI